MDDIHVINQVMEKAAEYNKPLCLDKEKAFDSVLKALGRQGAPRTCVDTLADIYNDSTATLPLHKKCDKITTQRIAKLALSHARLETVKLDDSEFGSFRLLLGFS